MRCGVVVLWGMIDSCMFVIVGVLPAMGALSVVIVQPLIEIPAPSPTILAPTAFTECSSMVPCLTGN